MKEILKIFIYQKNEKVVPYLKWFDNLDNSVRIIVLIRLNRLIESGNFGNCEPVVLVYMNLKLIMDQDLGFILENKQLKLLFF